MTGATTAAPEALIELLDSVLYLERKQVVGLAGVRLNPSESHLLMCALEGLTFTQIANRFSISKSAVSQVFSRLSAKGVVVITKAPRRRNAASVSLTPLGEGLRDQTLSLRRELARRVEDIMCCYDATEQAAVLRFIGELHRLIQTVLSGIVAEADQAKL